MRKLLPVALLVILVIASMTASAAISIDSVNKQKLNLGDKLRVSYNLSGSDMEALFRLQLMCGTFELDYYTIPVSIRSTSNKSIVAPPLAINSQMLGTCSIKAVLQSTDKIYTEEIKSADFEVSSNIGVFVDVGSKNFFPGEKMIVQGSLEESYSPTRSVAITLDRSSVTLGVDTEHFNQSLQLAKNIKSGEHKVQVDVTDPSGNKGSAEAVFNVAQVASSILINMADDHINPGDKVKMFAVIMDQANDSMPGKISLRLETSERKEVFSRDVDSNQVFDQDFSPVIAPGIYMLKAQSSGLRSERKVVINTIESASVTFDGTRFVKVKNDGNVLYAKYLELKFVDDKGREFPILRRLNLKPGAEDTFDLFRELPTGVYSLKFTSGSQPFEYTGIKTTDERSVIKKAADSVSGIGGMVVGSNASEGLLFKKPVLALITVITIIILLVVVYKSETQRRKELQERNAHAQEAERTKNELLQSDPIQDEREKSKKFVESMLKEKQFR